MRFAKQSIDIPVVNVCNIIYYIKESECKETSRRAITQ